MITLQHAIKIVGSRPAVFQALTDVSEMAQWHLGAPEGRVALGEILTISPKSGARFGWRTDRLEPDSRLVQTCVEGSGTSPGRTLSFELSDSDDGRTLVELSDGEWRPDDPHMPFCNTHWGEVLHRVKDFVERNGG